MPTEPTADEEVVDNVAESRYEIRADGDVAGFAAYTRSGDHVTFTHTEIDDAFEGRGLGSRLARAALDHTRQQHRTVTPECPFIAGYIERHPEYNDLIHPGKLPGG